MPTYRSDIFNFNSVEILNIFPTDFLIAIFPTKMLGVNESLTNLLSNSHLQFDKYMIVIHSIFI